MIFPLKTKVIKMMKKMRKLEDVKTVNFRMFRISEWLHARLFQRRKLSHRLQSTTPPPRITQLRSAALRMNENLGCVGRAALTQCVAT